MSARTPQPPAPDLPPTEVVPPEGQRLSWWRRGWGVAAIGVVCLLIGIGIGSAGSSSTNKSKPAPTPAQLAAQAAANKERVQQEAVAKATANRERVATEKKEAAEHAAEHRAQVRREQHEADERRHEEAKEHEEEARKKAEEVKTFTGTGGENLGTVNVTTESTLHWECPPCGSDNFAVTNSPNDSNQMFVNTINRTSGETHVDEGTYHDVSVNTEGEEWTIKITPNE